MERGRKEERDVLFASIAVMPRYAMTVARAASAGLANDDGGIRFAMGRVDLAAVAGGGEAGAVAGVGFGGLEFGEGVESVIFSAGDFGQKKKKKGKRKRESLNQTVFAHGEGRDFACSPFEILLPNQLAQLSFAHVRPAGQTRHTVPFAVDGELVFRVASYAGPADVALVSAL